MNFSNRKYSYSQFFFLCCQNIWHCWLITFYFWVKRHLTSITEIVFYQNLISNVLHYCVTIKIICNCNAVTSIMHYAQQRLKFNILICCPIRLGWLLSTPRSRGCTPRSLQMPELLPISKAKPCHSPKKPHFSHLYPWPCPFGRYPELRTTYEGQSINRW